MCAGLFFTLSITLSLLFVIAGDTIFRMFNVADVEDHCVLIILGVAGGAFYELFSNWATRKNNFLPVARTTIWQSLLGATSKIGLGWLGVKPWGLLVGTVFSKGG